MCRFIRRFSSFNTPNNNHNTNPNNSNRNRYFSNGNFSPTNIELSMKRNGKKFADCKI